MDEETEEKTADVDLDGTVADYDKRMQEELEKLRSPHEPPPPDRSQANYEDGSHMSARRLLIKSQPGFWRNLPRIERGFEVVQVLREIGFGINVLTKGPKARSVLLAWTEKAEWSAEHMPYASVTITQHKHRHYSRVLFDDWPDYWMPWARVRPRGLVISVAQPWNAGIEHPNFIRYDGTNLQQVRERAQRAFDRKSREPL
jgi:5'(3')-deoxyribonucleotidase